MLEENSFETFIQDAAEKASYSGALGIKFVIDREESEYPIMIAYAKVGIDLGLKDLVITSDGKKYSSNQFINQSKFSHAPENARYKIEMLGGNIPFFYLTFKII